MLIAVAMQSSTIKAAAYTVHLTNGYRTPSVNEIEYETLG